MTDRLHELFTQMFQAHPWHGVDPGEGDRLQAYLEILPADTVKVELDKPSGLLRVDRPQRYSSLCPMPYGFVPQTYCAERVAARTGRTNLRGDGDPLDICVLTERALPRADLLVRCVPIGGLRLVDKGEADDKIVAVLEDDAAFGDLRELAAVPAGMLARLRHYFLSYKQMPGELVRTVVIDAEYGREEALAVLAAARADYAAHYGEPAARWREFATLLR